MVSDEELIVEYRNGNKEAFETLTNNYKKKLSKYLYKYLRDAHMVEDVLQQIFMKFNKFDVTKKFKPWIYKVAKHQAIDCNRRKKSKGRIMLSLDWRKKETNCDLASFLGKYQLEPSEELEIKEREEKVWLAVNNLSDKIKETVILVFFTGVKYSDAANSLGIPIGTVKSRINLAMRHLYKVLK